MQQRVDKRELLQRISGHLGRDTGTVEEIVAAFLEEIYQAIKNGDKVSLQNFGTFYVRPEKETWVFRFNPSQRWRALFGWSSTYKGDL